MPKRKKYPSFVGLRLTGDMMEKIRKIADVKEWDISEVIRTILEDYLQ